MLPGNQGQNTGEIMRRFTAEEMLIAFELEQMLYDYIEELDLNNSENAGKFYAEDGAFVTPGGSFVGPAAIQAFYDKRNENVKKYQRDGQRTGRHTFLNVRCHFHDANNATLKFTNVNYAAEGPAPAAGLKGPSAVADCTMKYRRQADGSWLFTEFKPSQALLGEDDFMKLMLSMASK
jgi:hypothetical protein